MQKILVVDDDESMRNLLRARLSDTYEIIDTGVPEQALALALEHKPEAVLLDLMMPKFSGFELCQSLRSLSYTSRIPVFVITGKALKEAQEHCEQLGATAYFEKPVDFASLKQRLVEELQTHRVERRAHVRVRMRVSLKLRGTDAMGRRFEELIATENVSAGGFLCSCAATVPKGALVEVFLVGGTERYVGTARMVRQEAGYDSLQRYGFQLEEKTGDWVLQD
jgi:response regulator RpfG family c-di-GMP phosphodiesterase